MVSNIQRLRFDEQPERLPPHNLEAEEAVLGSVLLDREVIGRIAGTLAPSDFYRERHALVYQAMLNLYEQHEHVDYLTLLDELDRSEKLEQAGGFVFLSSLLGVVPTPIHAGQYARMVADTAFMRRLISAGGKIATIGFQYQYDPATALEKAEQILFDVDRKRATGEFMALSDVLRDYLDRLAALQDEPDARYGVPCGFTDLDRALVGGFQRSDLILLAARPSIGKTSLGLGIVANAATQFKAVSAVFSLEMSKEQLAARLLSVESGVDATKLRSGQIDDQESRKLGHALGLLAEAPIYIDDTPGISVMSLRSKARRLHQDVPLDLIVVDHIQLVTTEERGGDRVSAMTVISQQLKALARELHVPVIALSQLNRSVESRNPKIPILSDLRESGSLEQDADVVIFMYREDYYDRDSERPGVTDLHIAKHRNGPTGQVSLLFNQRTTKFLDCDSGGW